jgi:anthranilate synthase component 1
MVRPTKEEFKNLAKSYNLIPVYREIICDVDTPVSAFQKLRESEYAFLLESAEGGERFGRYSFLGNSPYLIFVCRQGTVEIQDGAGRTRERIENVADPLSVMKELLRSYNPVRYENFPPFYGGAVGYLGYDAIRYFENIPRGARDDLMLPEMVFFFTDSILIFDHLKHQMKVVVNTHLQPDTRIKELNSIYDQAVSKIDQLVERIKTPTVVGGSTAVSANSAAVVKSNMAKEDFISAVEKAKEYIRAGDVLQVVLSQCFSTTISASPFDIYRALRTINPAPYMYYLKLNSLELIGSSPEPLGKVQGDQAITCPIAGTRPRGKTKDEDERLEGELLSDEKERAEHIMLVDLGRNDLGRVCAPATVKVDDLMYIEKASHVMHIVTHVSGKLAHGKDAFDALRACFPAGTVTGAPKIRAMEIVDELEPTLRGPYAGIVGYFGYSGDLDSCITIRTIIVNGKKAYVQAGAGIVYDSKPEREYQETVDKAQALLSAVRLAEKGI